MSAIAINAASASTSVHAEPPPARPVLPFVSTQGCEAILAGDDLPASCPRHRRTRAPASDRSWIIYLLVCRTSGRCYVGLTSRDLESRLRAHTYQARRTRAVRSGGLMEALRAALAGGQSLTDAFSVHAVGTAVSREAARQLERRWIEDLGCRRPRGLNDMPGGGVGGRAGSVELAISLPDGTTRRHDSIHDAILARNVTLRGAGLTTLNSPMVYGRLALGWSPAEALGYRPHQDGRSARDAVTFGRKGFTSLRAIVAGMSGLSVDTLRSRLHRRAQAGLAVDLAYDLRRSAPGHQPRRAAPLGLHLPGVEGPLTVTAHASLVGLPKSTVQHWWHAAIRARLDPARMSPIALLQRLSTCHDRRRLVTLQLPDGRCWTGGERELVRRVLADASLEASRVHGLSESGIRRRLRLLPDRDRRDPAKVAGAFGFDLSIGGEG